MFPFRRFAAVFLLLMGSAAGFAKTRPLAVIDWPSTGTPVVRFSFGAFRSLPEMGALRGYVMEVTAENLSSQPIVSAVYTVDLFDKHDVRVGEDTISLSNVGPQEVVRFQDTVMASGRPASVAVRPATQSSKSITLTVNSNPQGALLKVDGKPAGATPRLIQVGAGHHILSFSKDGFRAGDFPLDIGPDDVSGGTVNYDLGAAALDTIELRDGSVLTGDLISISGMDVEVRVGGSIQHIDRNQIRRILLAHREEAQPSPPAAASTAH